MPLFITHLFRLVLIGFLVFMFVLSFLKTTEVPREHSHILYHNSQFANFVGMISDEPDVRLDHRKLIIDVTQVDEVSVHGRVLVSASLYPEYQYGDIVRVSCRLRAPEAFNGFAYDEYLAQRDIYSLCSFPKITLLDRDQGSWYRSLVFEVRQQLRSAINRGLPEPHASLLAATLFDIRGGIPSQLLDDFNATGTTHLMAISGSHITILTAMTLQTLLGLGFSRRRAFWLVVLMLILYVIVIGFPPSAVRAAIMGFLVMLGMQLGRLGSAGNAMLLAAGMMVAADADVIRDLGFQLSFAAVLGIIYFYRYFESWLQRVPEFFELRSVLAMSFAAQLTTMPIVIYNFERLSLISPLANIFVVPTFPYILVIGLAAVGLSFISSMASQFIFWPVYFLFSYIIAVVHFFSELPYAAISF